MWNSVCVELREIAWLLCFFTGFSVMAVLVGVAVVAL